MSVEERVGPPVPHSQQGFSAGALLPLEDRTLCRGAAVPSEVVGSSPGLYPLKATSAVPGVTTTLVSRYL